MSDIDLINARVSAEDIKAGMFIVNDDIVVKVEKVVYNKFGTRPWSVHVAGEKQPLRLTKVAYVTQILVVIGLT